MKKLNWLVYTLTALPNSRHQMDKQEEADQRIPGKRDQRKKHRGRRLTTGDRWRWRRVG